MQKFKRHLETVEPKEHYPKVQLEDDDLDEEEEEEEGVFCGVMDSTFVGPYDEFGNYNKDFVPVSYGSCPLSHYSLFYMQKIKPWLQVEYESRKERQARMLRSEPPQLKKVLVIPGLNEIILAGMKKKDLPYNRREEEEKRRKNAKRFRE